MYEYVAHAPAFTFAAFSPEFVAQHALSPCGTSSSVKYIAPAPAVSYTALRQQLPPAYTLAAVTTGVYLDITGSVNPQFSISAVESSAPQGVDSLPSLEEGAAFVYSRVHQEQFVAEKTTST